MFIEKISIFKEKCLIYTFENFDIRTLIESKAINIFVSLKTLHVGFEIHEYKNVYPNVTNNKLKRGQGTNVSANTNLCKTMDLRLSI